jgi:hypothetical protein
LGVVDAVCSTDRTGDCATGVCPDAAAEEGASLGGGTGVVGSTMFGAVWPSLALTPWLLPVTISRSSASGCKCGSGGFKVVPAFSLPAGWVVVAEMSLTAYHSENAKVNMVNGVDSTIKCNQNRTKQLTSQSTALKEANNFQRSFCCRKRQTCFCCRTHHFALALSASLWTVRLRGGYFPVSRRLSC